MPAKRINKASRPTPLRGTHSAGHPPPEADEGWVGSDTPARKVVSAPPKEFLKALVADDNAAMRRLVADYLELLGFEVVALAANGEAAVELFKERSPGLVIMDVKMPKMTGIEAAREISKVASVPIILLTGHSSEEVAHDAIEAGVFGYLVKPVTKKQLLPAIRLAIARFEQFRKLRRRPLGDERGHRGAETRREGQGHTHEEMQHRRGGSVQAPPEPFAEGKQEDEGYRPYCDRGE